MIHPNLKHSYDQKQTAGYLEDACCFVMLHNLATGIGFVYFHMKQKHSAMYQNNFLTIQTFLIIHLQLSCSPA